MSYVCMSQQVDTTLWWHHNLGHTQSQNLLEILWSKCWWPHMTKDVQEILQQCKVCKQYQKTKAPPRSNLPVMVHQLFAVWALDIVGPFPWHLKSKCFIITAINYATRWLVAQATTKHNGATIQSFIGKEIISKFGTPRLIITDSAKEMMGKGMKAYLGSQGVRKVQSTLYHPQANGCVEWGPG